MCADVIDIDTAQTGQQRAGAYMSIWSMVKKGAYALGTMIGLVLVVYWGFDSLAEPRGTTNSEFSLLMLACTYSVLPAIFKFVGMPLLWIYPLTEEKLRDVQAEIDERHGIGGA
jgi:Na+/melibiose symporter-like transporter